MHATRMTRFLESHMPSMQATWWTSSHTGTIGHIFQNRWVRSRKVRALPLSSACESLPKSQDTNALSHLDDVSFLMTAELPHDLHLHLCVPALVLPFFFISAPQMPNLLLDTAHPVKSRLSSLEKLA